MEADREAEFTHSIEFELVDIAKRAAIAEVAGERVVNVLLIWVIVAFQFRLKALLPEIEGAQGFELDLTRNTAFNLACVLCFENREFVDQLRWELREVH